MTHRDPPPAESFSSNAVRLSIVEWCALVVLVASLAVIVVEAWKRFERFEPSHDYRVPYESSDDYWTYERWCQKATDQDKTFVLGDSFVWGQYVSRDEGFSHFLNREAGRDRFANAGLDGTHPLALEGLVRHHCGGLRNREVILHLNLLWMSSPEADLQTERGGRLNHPRLVPQFARDIPSYSAPVSERIGVVVARHFPVLAWARHIQITYLGSADLNRWSLEHPYGNPLREITLELPEADDQLHPDAAPWFADGDLRQDPPWVGLEASLQWEAFQRLVAVLQNRGNRLFVVVGPLNEHMLAPSSRAEYREILVEVEDWLKERKLPYYLPPLLPSELYADLSHPLGQGYARLAQGLWERMSVL